MCHHTRRCALTLSPCGPHHFTHHRCFQFSDLQSEIAFEFTKFVHSKTRGWFAFCCTCRRPRISNFKFEISDLRLSGAPPLAGSLPCSVRTFLSWTIGSEISNLRSEIRASSSDRPTC